jgi:hypothetical protein
VKTLKVDKHKRVRIADFKPGQILAYTNNGDNTFTLTLVKAEPKERFPRGSLLKYFNQQKDLEETAIMGGCVLGPE